MITIQQTDNPEIAQELYHILHDLSAQLRGNEEKNEFVFEARDEKDTLIGGISGHTYRQWIYMDDLWVSEKHRKQGLGSKLLFAAEKLAIERECHGSYLITYDSCKFYEQHGYAICGQLNDFPKGHTRFFMKKAFTV
jgi:predicted N-acetyltransferase YhbS